MRKKLGEMLLDKGLISDAQLQEALKRQRETGDRLGNVLCDLGFLTEQQVVDVVAERLSIPCISIPTMVIDPAVIKKVNVEIARRYLLIPVFALGRTLTLAMADPLNIIAIEEVKYHTGLDIRRAIAPASEIKEAIEEYYSVADSLQEIVVRHESEERESLIVSNSDTEEIGDSPIIKLVNLIVNKAIRDRASDVHIEPDESELRIRYRVNGAMREEASPPKSMQSEILTRIKVAANLDVSEKRIPQDGRFAIRTDSGPVDLRVSTLPTIHGEKIVIRILDRRNLFLTFPQLGFDEALDRRWQNLIMKPEGLILISGPTSSGKTSTLYTTLQTINSVEKNILTVEDPVEYSLPLINQIQINEKAGLGFASTLRSILRQNPDIIMIGEIRDRETAQMAVRSALTGHLVFSTIHTNDAPSAITRLTDMGLESYLLASALQGVMAQRLVRTNCPHCLEPYTPLPVTLGRAGLRPDVAAGIAFHHGAGCSQCKNTGFQSQTGVFELIEISPNIAEMIMRGDSVYDIKREASGQGYVPLFEAGLEKVRQGQICLEELLKETSFVDSDDQRKTADRISVINNVDPIQI